MRNPFEQFTPQTPEKKLELNSESELTSAEKEAGLTPLDKLVGTTPLEKAAGIRLTLREKELGLTLAEKMKGITPLSRLIQKEKTPIEEEKPDELESDRKFSD